MTTTLKCQLCDQPTPGTIKTAVFGAGLWLCEACYYQVRANQHKLYSKLMSKFAMREAGYPANLKFARMNGSLPREHRLRAWRCHA